jgi:hypothetical protein
MTCACHRFAWAGATLFVETFSTMHTEPEAKRSYRNHRKLHREHILISGLTVVSRGR